MYCRFRFSFVSTETTEINPYRNTPALHDALPISFIINAQVSQNSDGAAGKASLRKQRRSRHEKHNVGRFYNLSDTPLDIAHKHANSARPAKASANQCRLGGHARGKLQGMQHPAHAPA